MLARGIIIAAFGLSVLAVDARAGEEGKQVFLDHKCNTCHSVKSAGITAAEASGAPDLSEVGARHDTAWMSKYLQKQEAIEGRKHKKKFQGDDKELEKLVTWLASLKPAK